MHSPILMLLYVLDQNLAKIYFWHARWDTSLWNIDTTFCFVCLVVNIPRWDTLFAKKMPPKLRSKATIKSPDSRSDVVEATWEGRVSALVEQIENLMNSPVQQ